MENDADYQEEVITIYIFISIVVLIFKKVLASQNSQLEGM